MTDSQRAHPHPQLQRPHWTSLNGSWRFLFDDERTLHHPLEIDSWDKARELQAIEVTLS